MRTLDEVIKAYEYCQNGDWKVGCGDCVYKKVKHGACKCVRNDDALHYLKAYKDDKDDLTALRAYWAEQQENNPLTWNELKQMEGKPVWVEDSNQQGEWVLLSGMEDEVLYFVYHTCNEYKIYRKEQGTLWQAYRKERL